MRQTSLCPHVQVHHRHPEATEARNRACDAERLARVLADLSTRHHVPGVQLAVSTPGDLITVEIGEREHGTGRPLGPDDKVPVGSITKALTATLAMILVGDGDLDLDEPIGEILPELGQRPGQLGRRLTLRQLLSHTSGLPSDLDDEDGTGASTRRCLLDRCKRMRLVHEPGRGFSYSTAGYVLVGELIATVTGMTWQEAIESILLRPLGIDAVFVGGPEAGRITPGHAVNTRIGVVQAVDQIVAPMEAPAGALALSARDLITFGRLHLADGGPRLLDRAVAEQMHRPVPAAEPVGLADGWGLGLAVFHRGRTRWLGHDGTGDGTWSHLRIDPLGGVIVALTATATTGVALWDDLMPELADLGLPPARYTAPARPRRQIPLPMECVGRYLNGDTEYAVAVGKRGRSRLDVDGREFAELTVEESLAFSLTELATGQRIPAGRFIRDVRTGRVDGLQISGRLARRQ